MEGRKVEWKVGKQRRGRLESGVEGRKVEKWKVGKWSGR